MDLKEIIAELSNDGKPKTNGNYGYSKVELMCFYNIINDPKRPTMIGVSKKLLEDYGIKMSSSSVSKYITDMEALGLKIPERTIAPAPAKRRESFVDYGLRFMDRKSKILLPEKFAHLEGALNV